MAAEAASWFGAFLKDVDTGHFESRSLKLPKLVVDMQSNQAAF
jgi:hypothetical protein